MKRIMEETNEDRLVLSEDVYIIMRPENIVFVHQDSVTYPDTIILKAEDLVPCIVFDHTLTKADISWILSMKEELHC